MTLKLLSYNIRFGGRGREEFLSEVIRAADPDIVVFQEAIHPSIIQGLARATGLTTWAARPRHSLGYISRIDIQHHEWHHPAGAKHPFLEIVPAGHDLRIFGLHLSAMFSKWTERRRAREIRALLEGIRKHQGGFHVIMGDFNALAPGAVLDTRRMPAWIRAVIWLSGSEIQRETVQVLLDANYVDGFRLVNPEERGASFPTWDPHLRLDYIFLPKECAERLTVCEILTRGKAVRQASDHFPLLSHLLEEQDS